MAKSFKRAIAVLLSALMIATTLPFTAITAMAAESVTYNFTGDNSCSNAYKTFTEAGHTYDIWGASGSGSTDGTNLTLQNSAVMFVNDGTVREYFQDGAFSIVFKGRHHAEPNRVLGTVSTPDVRFIRLDSNGDFYVNNIKATTIDLAGGANNTYAFSYDGANTVELYVNGIKRASVNASLDIPNDGTRYVSLGWADGCGDKMDNASFDYLTVSNDVYDPSTFTAGKKASATSDVNVKTGNATGRFYNYETPDYYSNLLYCNNDVVWSGNGTSDTAVTLSNINYKICFPSKVVMMHDGKTAPSFPAKMECKSTDTGKTRCYVYIDSAKDYLTFNKNWIMNTRAWDNWDISVTEDSTGYSSDNRLRSNENQAANKNTSRFWYNNAYYSANLDSNTTYVRFTDVAFTCHLNSNWDATYVDTHNTVNNNRGEFYVVNYKPIADIYADVKAKVADVAGKADGYYVNADEFYSVASNLLNLDPNAYGYGNTYYDVLACAQDIKEAVIDYNAVELVKHECVAGDVVEENIVAPTASKAGSHDNVTYCTVCEAELSRTPVVDNATGNYEAYDTAEAEAEAKVEAEYTAESWSNLEDALADAKALAESAETQDDIDAATTMIQTAVNELVSINVTVTKYVFLNNEQVGEAVVDASKYGAVYTATVDTDKNVQKWTVETSNTTQKIASSEKSASVVLTGNTIINVYLTDDKEGENPIKVTYLGHNGKAVAIDYVADASDINTDDTFAKAIPFYSFSEWLKSEVSATEYVMTPMYTPINPTQCQIVLTNFTDVDGNNNYRSYYDARIEYDKELGKDSVLKCVDVNGEAYYIPASGSFNVPYTSKLTVTLVDKETAEASIHITGQYKKTSATNTPVAVFNTAYYLPAGASVVEAGVVATISDSIASNSAAFAIGTKGVVKSPNSYATASFQFTQTITSTFGGANSVYGRPYIVYDIDGNTYTTYGNVVSINIK